MVLRIGWEMQKEVLPTKTMLIIRMKIKLFGPTNEKQTQEYIDFINLKINFMMVKMMLIAINMFLFSLIISSENINKFNPTFYIDTLKYLHLDYSLLSKHKIIYEVVEDENILVCKQELNKGTNKYQYITKYIYSIIYNISYLRNNVEIVSTSIGKDSIIIMNKKFSADSLLYGKSFNNVSVGIQSCYRFDFTNHKFIAIYLKDWSGPCFVCDYSTILFDITDTNNIVCIRAGIQSDNCTFDCFSDFNQDGKLDFLCVNLEGDYEMGKVYTLQNNEFILQNDYYLKLKIIEDYNIYIDVSNSKWFFDLEKTYPDKIIFLND